MRRGRLAYGLAVCLLMGILAGCSPAAMRADRLFGAGDYAGAAAAYEEALANAGGRGNALWLYRLGVSRAIPGDSAYDPSGAIRAFHRLRESFPESRYSRMARLPLSLLESLVKVEREGEALKGEMAHVKARLKIAGQTEQDLAECRQRAAELADRVGRQEKTVEDLQRELQQLKSIDLRRGR